MFFGLFVRKYAFFGSLFAPQWISALQREVVQLFPGCLFNFRAVMRQPEVSEL
jgi:hypothetical protein